MKGITTRLCVNPIPNLYLRQSKHFYRICHSLIKDDRVPMLPNFAHYTKPNCIPNNVLRSRSLTSLELKKVCLRILVKYKRYSKPCKAKTSAKQSHKRKTNDWKTLPPSHTNNIKNFQPPPRALPNYPW